jgi:GT2 family glycosyltransferase
VSTLRECLAALLDARSPQDEIILFDDGSTDATNEIAREAGVRILRNDGPPQGPAYGRNEAARAAERTRLLFVDADVILHPDAVDRLSDAMDAAGAVAAFGSYDDKPRSLRATSLYANLRHHFVHQSGLREASTFWSGIGMIERDVFLGAGGFDRAMFRYPSVEDVELGMRVKAKGHRILLVPEANGTHWKDWSLWRVWHTDVVRRALPWSRLIADGEVPKADLNLSSHERLLAILALSVPVLLFLGIFWHVLLFAAGIALLLYLWEGRRFFGFLRKRLPPAKFIVAVAMHWCYHIYAPATLGLVLIATRLGLRRPLTRAPINPQAEADCK